jgi:formylglycine-generating enzyme required for sulfatase activity
MFAALSSFRSWAGKRKRLLAGVVNVAVETASSCVPGVNLAARLIGELAEKATEDILDPDTGRRLSQEQLQQLNGWLENLAGSYAGLLDRLDQLPVADGAALEQVTVQVKGALAGNAELAQQFDSCVVEVRRQTLALGLIERKLDEHFHVQQKVSASLEEIKELFAHSPFMADWAAFRCARPEAVRAVVEADEHFLAGRREQGIAILLDLLRQRGVGEATLAHQLGLVEFGQGQVQQARARLTQIAGSQAILQAQTYLSTVSGKTAGLPVWRSLPRGFLVGRKYKVDSEVGRGGMASVYRAMRTARFEKEPWVAIKVPATELMRDPATRQRFEQEIDVSRNLSAAGHAHIVRVFDYEIFDDPYTGQELYGMVMEFVEGQSLARYLARRKAANRPLSLDDVRGVMERVCAALEHAHTQPAPVFHRDLKPANVMVGKGLVKLMDFGIARVLEEGREPVTRAGQAVGTLAYMPPELFGASAVVDARTDVYLSGNLLLELLTFDPAGDAEARSDCPAAWIELIADSMNRVRGKRPATISDFAERLRQASGGRQPPVPARQGADAPRLAAAEEDLAEMVRRMMQQVVQAHGQARQEAAQHRYAEAARILEAVPEHLRDGPLYREVCQKRDRAAALDRDIRQQVQGQRYSGLRPLVNELLALEPGRAELRRLLEALPGEEAPREVTNSIGMKLVLILPGKFSMGSPRDEANRYGSEGPTHEVEITKPFYLGIYPVTQEEYRKVMGTNPSHLCASGGGKDKLKDAALDTKRFPVESVSWEDAVAFCKKLSALPAEKAAGRVYRLPTEAEWEYACRAGTTTAFAFGDALSSTQANFDGAQPYGGAKKGPALGRTCPVGSYKANAWGLHDMHGNIWEWCNDWQDASYYGTGPMKDPQGPATGKTRVSRGGAWGFGATHCRSAYRGHDDPAGRYNNTGMRVVCVVPARG